MSDLNPIADQAAVATRGRNGRNGHGERRPAPRSRIEAAAAANAHAAQEHQAVGDALGALYQNRLIACLDLEGLGAELSDPDREAVLTLIRSLEARAVPLPQRQPGAGNGTGPQPAQRMP